MLTRRSTGSGPVDAARDAPDPGAELLVGVVRPHGATPGVAGGRAASVVARRAGLDRHLAGSGAPRGSGPGSRRRSRSRGSRSRGSRSRGSRSRVAVAVTVPGLRRCRSRIAARDVPAPAARARAGPGPAGPGPGRPVPGLARGVGVEPVASRCQGSRRERMKPSARHTAVVIARVGKALTSGPPTARSAEAVPPERGSDPVATTTTGTRHRQQQRRLDERDEQRVTPGPGGREDAAAGEAGGERHAQLAGQHEVDRDAARR